MDLIPDEFRRRLRNRNLVRWLVLACAMTLVGIGVAWALIGYLTAREKADVVRLEGRESVAAQQRAKAQAYQQSKERVEKQLLVLDELRDRDSVGLFLHAIDGAYGEGIWFDSVHFQRSGGAGTLPGNTTALNPAVIVVPSVQPITTQVPDIPPGIHIVGHATSHSILADFIRKLGMQPSVADVRLIDTRLRTYTSTQVVDFSLSMRLDKRAGTRP